jgi:hypothetical protein
VVAVSSVGCNPHVRMLYPTSILTYPHRPLKIRWTKLKLRISYLPIREAILCCPHSPLEIRIVLPTPADYGAPIRVCCYPLHPPNPQDFLQKRIKGTPYTISFPKKLRDLLGKMYSSSRSRACLDTKWFLAFESFAII